jgi:uncharacterized protein YwlG (UPF0340 family)
MNEREAMEEMLRSFQRAVDTNQHATVVHLAYYGPELIDMAIRMDRLQAENERLSAIVNLIELKTENDDLKQRLEALEKAT